MGFSRDVPPILGVLSANQAKQGVNKLTHVSSVLEQESDGKSIFDEAATQESCSRLDYVGRFTTRVINFDEKQKPSLKLC